MQCNLLVEQIGPNTTSTSWLWSIWSVANVPFLGLHRTAVYTILHNNQHVVIITT